MAQNGNNSWKEFRASVIELDGNKCSICGKSGDESILQVHHKLYIKGKQPWEYATKDCITLCKGCHASEHGKIMPKFGWEYQGDEDLGDLIGTCENCGSSLRYVFYIFHEKWGNLEVGTFCCDSLTDTNIASSLVESQKRYDGRKKRFIESKRWKITNGAHNIKHTNFNVKIRFIDNSFYIIVLELKQTTLSKPYKTLISAKAKVFDIIESGELLNYCKKKGIRIESQKKYLLKRGNIAAPFFHY